MNVQALTYNRLIESAKVEQLLNNCSVFIDVNKLRSIVIVSRNDASKRKELYSYMKAAIDGDGFISSKYYSRDKRTFRIFTEKGSLNLINLNNPYILDCMTSRYPNGKIVCIDYSNFEFNIFKKLSGNDEKFPEDIHNWASSILNVPRDVAKIINHNMIYGNNLQSQSFLEKNSHVNNLEYLSVIFSIRSEIEDFIKDEVIRYEQCGYVVNHYGRRIYPKNSSSIFNNIIQSNGSEILIDSLIKLYDLSMGKNWNIMFQRFDAIYFDFSSESLKNSEYEDVIECMCCINDTLNYLPIKYSIGDSVYKLKEK